MERKPMFENEMCKSVGLMATCNSCDRIIFEDENDLAGYISDGRGYCRECREETDSPSKLSLSTESMKGMAGEPMEITVFLINGKKVTRDEWIAEAENPETQTGESMSKLINELHDLENELGESNKQSAINWTI